MTEDQKPRQEDHDTNTEIVLTFFAQFSKFEKVLKKAGFTTTRPGARNARPDWERFARHIEGKLDAEGSPELQGAIAYLIDRPIKRQTRRPIPGFRSDVLWMATVVQETANNLSRSIHFDRYSDSDVELVFACMVILTAFAECDPNMQRLLKEN